MNIVFVLADDMRWDLTDYMPKLRALVEDSPHAVLMRNGFNANPVCVPSRCSILTGNHSKTTGVYGNHQGFDAFEDASTIATALKEKGYTNSFAGKYVNNYNPEHAAYIPPGWDEWWAITDNGTEYYNYQVSDNGVARTYGASPEDYLTRVIAGRAEHFVATAPEPFMMYTCPVAPHEQAVPADRYRDAYVNMPTVAPSFNEDDVSDKSAWLQSIDKLNAEEKATLKAFKKNQIRTLWSIDDMLSTLVKTLKSRGILDNTLIVFASDNGYLWGEHRMKGKSVPFVEAYRMPLMVRAPFISDESVNDVALAQNIDFAPTFAEVAGVDFRCDGASLMPHLVDGAPSRTHLYVQNLGHGKVPGFKAVQGKAFAVSGQTPRYTYTKLDTGEEELYDLAADPYQLQNIQSTFTGEGDVLGVMRERLAAFDGGATSGTIDWGSDE